MLDDKQAVDATIEIVPDLRDESGAIRADLVERADAAVESGDADALRELVGEWHEADIGDLVAALDRAKRAALVGLLGPAFNFKALTELDETARNAILEA